MAYKQYPTDKYLKEVQQKLHLLEVQKPIIDKYYSEVRAKVKPTIEQLPENPSESQIRNYIINELSPILKNQTVNFVENLMKANDLMAFYKFGKAFLNEVKDIRNLDSSFLADLWSKYKSKMLIYAESNLPKTGLTATEYENALKHNRKIASSSERERYENQLLNYPYLSTQNNEIENMRLNDKNVSQKVPRELVLEQIKEYPMVRTKKQLLNKTRQILHKTKQQMAQNDLLNIVNIAKNTIAPRGYTAKGKPRKVKQSSTGRGLPGITVYARR